MSYRTAINARNKDVSICFFINISDILVRNSIKVKSFKSQISEVVTKMDRAIKHYFNKDIKEKIKLLNGWKETWLLILSDNQKLVFRACDDHANIFEREKFFYESVNKELGSICPKVYVVDGTCEYYAKTFQISEYIDGQNLGVCMKEFDEQKKREIYYKIGEITALINNIEINLNHLILKVVYHGKFIFHINYTINYLELLKIILYQLMK